MGAYEQDGTFLEAAGEWIVWVVTCMIDWFTKGTPGA